MVWLGFAFIGSNLTFKKTSKYLSTNPYLFHVDQCCFYYDTVQRAPTLTLCGAFPRKPRYRLDNLPTSILEQCCASDKAGITTVEDQHRDELMQVWWSELSLCSSRSPGLLEEGNQSWSIDGFNLHCICLVVALSKKRPWHYWRELGLLQPVLHKHHVPFSTKT